MEPKNKGEDKVGDGGMFNPVVVHMTKPEHAAIYSAIAAERDQAWTRRERFDPDEIPMSWHWWDGRVQALADVMTLMEQAR